MIKWKRLGKSKKKEQPIKEEPEWIDHSREDTKEELYEKQETTVEIQTNEKPLAEYRETLETGKDTGKYTSKQKATPKDQHIWRDVDSIEENIDNLNAKKQETKVSDLDKKVDKLIEKTKKRRKKPSNVIYVVSKPQPGQVRGDWAVRSHGKIFSHHRTKDNAVKEARKIAREREATVMVQNTDGTFSEGFKPRPKK